MEGLPEGETTKKSAIDGIGRRGGRRGNFPGPRRPMKLAFKEEKGTRVTGGSGSGRREEVGWEGKEDVWVEKTRRWEYIEKINKHT